MRSAIRLVELARSRVGQRYVLGCRVPYDDGEWAGPWDCAELVTWAVRQVTGELVGVTAAGDAYSGAWASLGLATCASWNGPPAFVPDAPTRVTPEIAVATVGAVLVRAPAGEGRSGHVALSTGAGGTVEAYSSTRGVIASRSNGRRWDVGILVPGVEYQVQQPTVLSVPRVLREGDRGASVLAVQTRLDQLGFPVGQLDSIFGPVTTRAVVHFQHGRGLVPDGEVGPLTTRELGL